MAALPLPAVLPQLPETKGPDVSSVADFLKVVHENSYANKFYDWVKADKYITECVSRFAKEMKESDDAWEDDQMLSAWDEIANVCAGFDLSFQYLEERIVEDDRMLAVRNAFSSLMKELRPDCFSKAS